MKLSQQHRHLLIVAGLCLGACNKPPDNAPGIEEQPDLRANRQISFRGPDRPPDVRAPGEGTTGTTRTPRAMFPPGPSVQSGTQVTFTPARGLGLQAKAQLHERADTVQVRLDVAEVPRGTKGLVLEQASDCQGLPSERASGAPDAPMEESPRALGQLRLTRTGKGSLESSVPHANLQLDSPDTLVGKALVLRSPGPGPMGSGSAAMLACAFIEPQG
jgi:hypothetical protein